MSESSSVLPSPQIQVVSDGTEIIEPGEGFPDAGCGLRQVSMSVALDLLPLGVDFLGPKDLA